MLNRALRFGIAGFILAVAVLLPACVPDVSGVSLWKKSQIAVVETIPPREDELAAASELAQWAITIEGVPGKDVFELRDAQSIRPASMDVRNANAIIRYGGIRLGDLTNWLGVTEYKEILFVGESAQETIGSDMDAAEFFLTWLRDGVSLTSPTLISREGVVAGGIKTIIIE